MGRRQGDARDRTLGVVPAAGESRTAALARLSAGATVVKTVPIPVRDLSALAAASRRFGEDRAEALGDLHARNAPAAATIDAALQSALYADALSLRDSLGVPTLSAVVIDVETGEQIVHLDAPGFDPSGWRSARLSDLSLTRGYGGYFDHAATLALAPGSTFKVVTQLAAVLRGIPISWSFDCRPAPGRPASSRGTTTIEAGDHSGTVVDASRDRSHGPIAVHRALVVSCNVYHARLGLAVGVPAFRALAARLPLHHFEIPDWGAIDLAVTAFGQGKTQVTTEGLATIYSAIAAGGVSRRCPVLGGKDGCTETRIAEEEQVAPIVAGLRDVVASAEGTARRARPGPGEGFTVYGKTGSAQEDLRPDEKSWEERSGFRLKRDQDGIATHGWFAGWIEGRHDRRRYAFAILAPRAGAGGETAARLAPMIGRRLVEHGYLAGPAAGSN